MTNQNRDRTSLDQISKHSKAEIKTEAESEFYIGKDSQNIPDAKPVRRSEKDKHWYCPYDFCGYKSARKANVRMHIVTHTGEKPFECDTCSTRFCFKHNLVAHKRLGKRVCQKVLARRGRLAITGLKRKQTCKPLANGKPTEWSCPYYPCEYKAWYKNHVLVHMLTHSEGEAFFVRCNYCKKSKYLNNLSYDCQHCDSALSRHYYGVD